jgi:hypothetical protein
MQENGLGIFGKKIFFSKIFFCPKKQQKKRFYPYGQNHETNTVNYLPIFDWNHHFFRT